jgi:hypothetical protein
MDFGANWKDIKGNNIAQWECQFVKPAEFAVEFTNEPYNYYILEKSCYIGGVKTSVEQFSEKEGTAGLEYYLLPKKLKSESEISDTSVKFMLNLTVMVSNVGSAPQTLNLGSNEITLKYDTRESDALVSVKNKLESFVSQVKWWKVGVSIVTGLLGVIAGCSLLSKPKIVGEMNEAGDVIGGTVKIGAALGEVIPWIVAGVGLTTIFFTQMWLTIFGSFLAGLGIGQVLLNIPGWGQAICGVFVKTEYIVYGLFVLEYAIFNKMSKSLDELRTNIDNEKAAAQTEVGESLAEYWGQT